MNLTCVPGLFTGILGLERPELGKTAAEKGVKVLVYGGSSSFGGLSIQYLSQAGYTVVTTSSPRNRAFVERLGAAKIIDHTNDADEVAKELIAAGPYKAIVDMISSPDTMSITGKVVEAQGGGKLYVMQPAMGDSVLPRGVDWVFEPWSDCLYEEKNRELMKWVVDEYIPHGIDRGIITPVPIEKIKGGLAGVDEALGRLQGGVSGVKLVADPWE